MHSSMNSSAGLFISTYLAPTRTSNSSETLLFDEFALDVNFVLRGRISTGSVGEIPDV